MGILRHEHTQRLEANAQEKSIAYGCLFCITGREERVARRIRESCPNVCAVTMRKMKYRVSHGCRSCEEAMLLPGYVFFEAPSDIDPFRLFPKSDILRILTVGLDQWRLYGEDERFARWLFRYDGLLDFSKAYCEGDRIRIVSGPLKDMEGKITKVDRRGRSGQVTMKFDKRDVKLWLGFDLIEKPFEIEAAPKG